MAVWVYDILLLQLLLNLYKTVLVLCVVLCFVLLFCVGLCVITSSVHGVMVDFSLSALSLTLVSELDNYVHFSLCFCSISGYQMRESSTVSTIKFDHFSFASSLLLCVCVFGNNISL